jgi:hypothetical protein
MHDADGWVKKDFVPFGSVSVGRPKNFTREAVLHFGWPQSVKLTARVIVPLVRKVRMLTCI